MPASDDHINPDSNLSASGADTTLNPITTLASQNSSPSDGYTLSGANVVVAVLQGRVSIFSQEFTPAGNPGRRQYLFDVTAGDFVFSVSKSETSSWLIIHDQARIKIWVAEKFFKTRTDSDKERVVRAVNNWVNQVCIHLLDEPRPVAPVVLAKGAFRLSAGQEATVEEGPRWVTIEKGVCSFLGQKELSLTSAVPPFPLTTRSWLSAEEKTKGLVVSTEDLLANDTIGEALQSFHLAIAKLWQTRTANYNAKKELDALERDQFDQSSFSLATNQFLQILAPGFCKQETSVAGSALFKACRLIGNASNLDFKMPARVRKSKEHEDEISQIAFESRCRYRLVRYEKDWFRRDGGPLLGFRGADNSPVALLPAAFSRFICVDPESDHSQVVDEKLTESLGKYAIMFYRSLGDTPQTPWQIMRFGLAGLSGELLQLWTMAVVAGLLSLALPLLAGRLFHETVPSANYQELNCIIVLLVAACLVQTIFHIIRLLTLCRIEQKCGSDLEAAIWDRLLRLPVSFFRQFTVGDLVDRTMSLAKLRHGISRNGGSLAYLLVVALCNLILMIVYDAPVAFAIILLVGFGLTLILLSTNARARIEAERMNVAGQFVAVSLELISNVAKLRLAGAELRALSLWAHKFAENQRLLYAGSSIETAMASQISLLPVGCTALLFVCVVLFTPGISVEDFITFNVALAQFLAALVLMYKEIPALYLLRPLFQRLKPLVEALPEAEQTAIDPGLLKGAIEFQSVSVGYEGSDTPVLTDISFRVNPGEFVAIVGRSGSGKSTILRTLIGFEKPTSGSVLVDGKDLSELDLRSVRRQMGVVLQNDKLIPGSVFLNIVGNSARSLEDAWDAVRMAGVADDVSSWPMGMETSLIEGAGTISGGQKQRLMVARAIVHKPRILVLDEATSAVDNKTQTMIMQSLKRLNATRIVVAQRLSTVQNTDRIYVVEQGRIVEAGTYKQLMAAKGMFAELARRQLA